MAAGVVVVALLVFTSNENRKHEIDTSIGAVLYATSCAACHGANLQGEADWQTPKSDGILPAPPHDEDGHTWHHSDNLLFTYTKLGGAEALAQSGVANFNSGMPAFEGILSDEEIEAILGYIKSTWPERIREIQQERTKAEEDL